MDHLMFEYQKILDILRETDAEIKTYTVCVQIFEACNFHGSTNFTVLFSRSSPIRKYRANPNNH